MTLRIVQWTTGNVGRQAVIAIARNHDLELVGCYAWSKEQVGRDDDFAEHRRALGRHLGHVVTIMPAINAIPAVVAAEPGIVTYADLRLPLPRGFVRS